MFTSIFRLYFFPIIMVTQIVRDEESKRLLHDHSAPLQENTVEWKLMVEEGADYGYVDSVREEKALLRTSIGVIQTRNDRAEQRSKMFADEHGSSVPDETSREIGKIELINDDNPPVDVLLESVEKNNQTFSLFKHILKLFQAEKITLTTSFEKKDKYANIEDTTSEIPESLDSIISDHETEQTQYGHFRSRLEEQDSSEGDSTEVTRKVLLTAADVEALKRQYKKALMKHIIRVLEFVHEGKTLFEQFAQGETPEQRIIKWEMKTEELRPDAKERKDRFLRCVFDALNNSAGSYVDDYDIICAVIGSKFAGKHKITMLHSLRKPVELLQLQALLTELLPNNEVDNVQKPDCVIVDDELLEFFKKRSTLAAAYERAVQEVMWCLHL